MTVITRSQSKKLANISLVKEQLYINIENYDSLEKVAKLFEYITNLLNDIVSKGETSIEYYEFCKKLAYVKIYDFIHISMNPTFEEIDAMLKICNTLLKNNQKHETMEFILNCPEKFLLTLVNNSESSPYVFYKLEKLGLENICNYLMPFVHETKLGTWNERKNAHIRGNLNFEHQY